MKLIMEYFDIWYIKKSNSALHCALTDYFHFLTIIAKTVMNNDEQVEIGM